MRLAHAHVGRHIHTRTQPRPVLPREAIDWAAAGWAGLVAGMGFIFLQSLLMTMFTGSGDVDVVRLIAAIALGAPAMPGATAFTALVFFAAMAVHLPLSLIYARALAVLIRKQDLEISLAIGAAFGVALYLVNYYAFTGLFPWFAAMRGWITLISHVAFGLLAAGTYNQLTARRR